MHTHMIKEKVEEKEKERYRLGRSGWFNLQYNSRSLLVLHIVYIYTLYIIREVSIFVN